MSELPLLQQLLNARGAPLVNVQEILKEIARELGRAATTDDRVALLTLFKSTMDVVESTVAPEDLRTFQDARIKHYRTYIVQEALVGEDVCVETLYAITQREIAAGRMAPDDELRRTAKMGMDAPHLSHAELVAMASNQRVKPRSIWQRVLAWTRRG